jgi:hypothetical protein
MSVEYVPNKQGQGALLKTPELQRELRRRALLIARAAGPGMRTEWFAGRTRSRARIWTATPTAMRAEATSRALTRAIDAGRG